MRGTAQRRVKIAVLTAAETLLDGFTHDEIIGEDRRLSQDRWEVLAEALDIQAMFAGSLFWKLRSPGREFRQEAIARLTLLKKEAERVAYPDLAEKIAKVGGRLQEYVDLTRTR